MARNRTIERVLPKQHRGSPWFVAYLGRGQGWGIFQKTYAWQSFGDEGVEGKTVYMLYWPCSSAAVAWASVTHLNKNVLW